MHPNSDGPRAQLSSRCLELIHPVSPPTLPFSPLSNLLRSLFPLLVPPGNSAFEYFIL